MRSLNMGILLKYDQRNKPAYLDPQMFCSVALSPVYSLLRFFPWSYGYLGASNSSSLAYKTLLTRRKAKIYLVKPAC
jgi:hypothetical protein